MTHLLLSSADLCSKWGFNDGGTPDEVWDLYDKHGIDSIDVDWHAVLRRLVREHLVPALAEHHQLEVYDIETSHNPIRASVIDGQEIDHYAMDDPVLTPEWVIIPMDTVLAVIRDEMDASVAGVVEGEVVDPPLLLLGLPPARLPATETRSNVT